MQIIYIGIAAVAILSVVVSSYIVNGRTVFDDRSEPTQEELEKIHEIINFEQEKLSECIELLKQYDDRVKKLGIEIRPVLDQARAVNQQGLVEEHDWGKDMWLPTFYHSKIICYIYKDGKMLENRTSYRSTSFFVDIYWLLYTGKNEDTTFNDKPFDYLDSGLDNLLNRVSSFLEEGHGNDE